VTRQCAATRVPATTSSPSPTWAATRCEPGQARRLASSLHGIASAPGRAAPSGPAGSAGDRAVEHATTAAVATIAAGHSERFLRARADMVIGF